MDANHDVDQQEPLCTIQLTRAEAFKLKDLAREYYYNKDILHNFYPHRKLIKGFASGYDGCGVVIEPQPNLLLPLLTLHMHFYILTY